MPKRPLYSGSSDDLDAQEEGDGGDNDGAHGVPLVRLVRK